MCLDVAIQQCSYIAFLQEMHTVVELRIHQSFISNPLPKQKAVTLLSAVHGLKGLNEVATLGFMHMSQFICAAFYNFNQQLRLALLIKHRLALNVAHADQVVCDQLVVLIHAQRSDKLGVDPIASRITGEHHPSWTSDRHERVFTYISRSSTQPSE